MVPETDPETHTITATASPVSRTESRNYGANAPTTLRSARSHHPATLLSINLQPPGRRRRRNPERGAQTDLPASRTGCGAALRRTVQGTSARGAALRGTTRRGPATQRSRLQPSPRQQKMSRRATVSSLPPPSSIRSARSPSSSSSVVFATTTPTTTTATATTFLLLLLLQGPLPARAHLNLTLGIFVPQTGSRRMGPEASVAINWTVERLNEQFGDLFRLGYIVKDTLCDKDLGLTRFVDTLCENKETDNPVHVVIGPTCDDVCQAVGGLGGNNNLPIISNGCGSYALADRTHYPTFLRTMGTYKDALYFLEDLFRNYKWTRITLVHGKEMSWLDISDELADVLLHTGFEARRLSIRHRETAKEDLKLESASTRVFLLCMYSEEVMYFMEMADELRMRNGKYAFIALDFANLAKSHANWMSIPILDGLLDVTFDVLPNSSVFNEFKNYVFSAANMAPNSSCPSDYELAIHASMLSDAVSLYAAVVNATMNDHCDPVGGRCFVEHMKGVSINGVGGVIEIDDEGHRRSRFMVHNIQDGCYVPIATYNEEKKITILGNPVIWPGGSRVAPANNPPCGWLGELCIEDNTSAMIIIVSTIAGLALVVCLLTLGAYKYTKWRESVRRMLGTDWKIDFHDLKRPKHLTGLSMTSSMFIRSSSQLGSAMSIESNASLRSAMRSNEGLFYYKGEVVAVKFITKNYGLGVPETPKLCRELNQILCMDHRNINPFVGACTEKDHLCLVNAYAAKGSLFDVLHKSDITFDCRFVASFATDVSKGLEFIHSSEVAYHGRLKSRNVFVDNMFTAKIGDFHMETFREGEVVNEDNECYPTRNLWSAIEVVTGDIHLQEKTLDARARTLLWQHADMWSFGVILHEIVNREKPYPSLFDTDPAKAEKMLADRVRPDEGHLEKLMTEIRARKTNISSEDQFTMKVLDLIASCWQTFADMRLSSAEAAKRLKDYAKTHKLLSKNMYENLMHMMTKNEDELNRQVQMRTELLENERNKTQNLLLQMLPPVVAKQLVQGKTPEAESYECVTIFFSDVVGFTQLCATVLPLEVMDIMNHLYLCFDKVIDSYNVYKVETIGDAYMVASGLPERNEEHAPAIADMALDLLSRMDSFEIPHKPNYHLNVRVGLHSGPVVAGVVGSKMPRYCVFGDTVNTASRMESHGKALLIHVSQTTRDLLLKAGGYNMVQRQDGLVVKGKGEMATYWLTGKDGFPREFHPPDVQATDNGTKGS